MNYLLFLVSYAIRRPSLSVSNARHPLIYDRANVWHAFTELRIALSRNVLVLRGFFIASIGAMRSRLKLSLRLQPSGFS